MCAQQREVIEEQTPFRCAEFLHMVSLLMLHKEAEKGRRTDVLSRALATVFSSTGKTRKFVVDYLGAILGAEMHEAYVAGVLNKSYLRSLFFRKTHLPGAARKAYFDVSRAVRPRSGKLFS